MTVTYAAGMRVALCQLPVSPDPGINLGRVREALSGAAGAQAVPPPNEPSVAVYTEQVPSLRVAVVRGPAAPAGAARR